MPAEKKQEDVSFVLIQVKNRNEKDNEFSTEKLNRNLSKHKSVCDIIRVNIDVLGEPEDKRDAVGRTSQLEEGRQSFHIVF
ncbi:hypothetical protein V7S43_011270 [Phytophthora oleae]|uniref:Uncharacterized protein n=1 Tax=Phytophthora oleae TaxID=2107226 RepID=A0ABD3FAD7_9STRA